MLDQLGSFKEMLWCLMMDVKSSPEKIELLLTCAWTMWGNKNDIRYGGTCKDGRMLLQWAMQYLEEYQIAVDSLPNAHESVQHILRWSLPPALCFKFNVDGAIFPELHSVGIGVIT